jgi:hypothetical protein
MSMGKRGRKRHTSRAAQERHLRPEARKQGGLLQEHNSLTSARE